MKKQFMLLFSVLVLGFVLAASCPPNIPITYYGEVSFDGYLLEGTYDMTAMLNHDIAGFAQVSGGEYYVDVSPCYGISSGEISFVINGVEANEKVDYNTENFGKEIELDLTLNTKPSEENVCRNGYIDAGEECDDGNSNSSDGCSSMCEVEYGYSCIGQPSVCIEGDYCGDGACNNGETCSSCEGDCGVCINDPSSCFPAGTKILMADKTEKDIEDVLVGDFVLSYDLENNKNVFAEVLELESPIRNHMCEIIFEDNFKLQLTKEHPVYTIEGWKSLNPFETLKENYELFVDKLEIGDGVVFVDGVKDILEINCWNEIVQTYNLKKVLDYNNYYAEGVLVHNKGGGGGGGSSTYYKCVEWNDWSECDDGEQTRICAEKLKCFSSEKTDLSETKNCVPDSVEVVNVGNQDNLEQQNQNPISPRITGSVIGFVKTKLGLGLITGLLIIILGGLVIIRIYKKRK